LLNVAAASGRERSDEGVDNAFQVGWFDVSTVEDVLVQDGPDCLGRDDFLGQ
jgi:hypothetical protein